MHRKRRACFGSRASPQATCAPQSSQQLTSRTYRPRHLSDRAACASARPRTASTRTACRTAACHTARQGPDAWGLCTCEPHSHRRSRADSLHDDNLAQRRQQARRSQPHCARHTAREGRQNDVRSGTRDAGTASAARGMHRRHERGQRRARQSGEHLQRCSCWKSTDRSPRGAGHVGRGVGLDGHQSGWNSHLRIGAKAREEGQS